MISREVVRRLRAFHAGRPIPKGETLHNATVDDSNTLIVAFLKMGGESRPWAIAYGYPNESPKTLYVPEGRNRDLVADMCAEFAPILLEHLRTPGYVRDEPAGLDDLAPLRQLWFTEWQSPRHAASSRLRLHLHKVGCWRSGAAQRIRSVVRVAPSRGATSRPAARNGRRKRPS